ncbi:unnamed protein product [Clonostachys rosea]|uniref:SPX domain-containing protein n=1 Tax=Bionectria ochroleuca TaxID=29856 RepID=A0ABY6UY97_BIOOC|nr:unnamed protein product [Clonostachys rosea]
METFVFQRTIQAACSYYKLPKCAKKQSRKLKSHLRTMRRWEKDFKRYGASALPTERVLKIIRRAEKVLDKFYEQTSFINWNNVVPITPWDGFKTHLKGFFQRLKMSFSSSPMTKFIQDMKEYSTQLSRLLEATHKKYVLDYISFAMSAPKIESRDEGPKELCEISTEKPIEEATEEPIENPTEDPAEIKENSSTTKRVVIFATVGCAVGSVIGGLVGGYVGSAVGAAVGTSVCGFIGWLSG